MKQIVEAVAMASASPLAARRLQVGGTAGDPYDVLAAILRRQEGCEPDLAAWQLAARRNSQSEAAVAVFARADGRTLVVKTAGTADGRRVLVREASALSVLQHHLRLRPGTQLLPSVVDTGRIGGRSYLALSGLPGEAGEALPDAAALERALAGAAHAVAGFHRATTAHDAIDRQHIDSWSATGAAALERTLPPRLHQAVPLVQAHLRAGLMDRSAAVGWTHGDYWLGNVLFAGDGSVVTGIVDWESAANDQLQVVDVLYLLIAARAHSRRCELGDVLRAMLRGDTWLPHEQAVLEVAAPAIVSDPEFRTAALLLTWLRHVGVNLAQSVRYARHHVWLRRNVWRVADEVVSLPKPRPLVLQWLRLPQAAAPLVDHAIEPRHLAWRERLRPLARPVSCWNVLPPLVLTSIAVGLWAWSLGGVDVRQMADIGLVSVWPHSMLAALALLSVSFALAVRRVDAPQPLLLLHVAVLILIVYGTPALVEEVPRFAVTWRHVGIADYIARRHEVATSIDAYFNWPSFFGLLAFLDGASGLGNALRFAAWAPVAFNLMYLAPLLLMFKTAVADRRLVWSAVWFFYCLNWVGQDYLSPQGLSYFLYLVLLAILFRFFVRPWVPSEVRPVQRVGAMATAILVFAALVPMHQLTPFAALAAIIALTGLGLCSARGLPLLGTVLVAGWMIYLATGYLAGHFIGLTGDVGNVEGAVGAGVGARVTGSSGHLAVIGVRFGLTALLWFAALAGAFRWRRRMAVLPFVAVAAAQFPLIGLQAYGGEMLLRVYLFALPFAAFFAAALFHDRFPRSARVRSRRATASIALAGCFLLAGLLVARYGNERMDSFTQDEVTAVQTLYDTAKPGSVIVAPSTNMPWKFRSYESYTLTKLVGTAEWRRLGNHGIGATRLVHQIASLARDHTRGAGGYVILTRSQQAEIDLLGEGPRDAIARVRSALSSSSEFRTIESNRDAAVFVVERRPRR